MHRLTSGPQPLVLDLIGTSPFASEARSIASGRSPGWIFVDDPSHPSFAFVGSKGMEGCWLFGGCDQPGLSDRIRDFAQNEGQRVMAEAGDEFLEISVASATTNAAIEEALESWETETITNVILLSQGPVPARSGDAPEVIPLHATLDRNLRDGVDVREKVRFFWEDADRLTRAGGFGFCCIVDGWITSCCMTAFVDDEIHCVDMETFEPFHRQGHGTAAASTFLRACADRSLVMHWSCMESNEASFRLARRIGLMEVARYTTHGLDYPLRSMRRDATT